MKKHPFSLLVLILLAALPLNAGFINRIVAPGDPSPTGNGTFSDPEVLACVADGFVFSDTLNDTANGSSDSAALVVWWRGALKTIFQEGDPAPDGNGVFSRIVQNTTKPVRITDTGLVIVTVDYRDTSVGLSDNQDLVVYDIVAETLTSLAREGSTSPENPGDIISNGGIDCYDVNPSGYLVLGLRTSGENGIYDISLPSGGWGTELVMGSASPDGNGTFSDLGVIRTGSFTNDFSFTSTLDGTTGGFTDNFGIFLHDFGVEIVAREGDPMPDGNGSYSLSGLSITPPHSGDDMFFYATAFGTTNGATDNSAILFYRGGVNTIVARKGDAEADGDGTYNFMTLKSGYDSRQAAFSASLSGTSGGSTNNSVLYRITATGVVSTIAREGQTLPNGQVLESINNFEVAPNLDVAFTDSFGIYQSSNGSDNINVIVDTFDDLPGINFPFFSTSPICADPLDGVVFSESGLFLYDDSFSTNYIGPDGGSWDNAANWSNLMFAPQYLGNVGIRPQFGITVNGPTAPSYPDAIVLDALGTLPMTFVLKPGGSIGLQDGKLDLDNAILTGSGVVTGEIDAGATSLIRPTGAMQLGDATDPLGFTSQGRIELNGQILSILDQDGAGLDGELELQDGTLRLMTAGGGTNGGVIRGSGRIEGGLLTNSGDINALFEHMIFDLPVTNAASTGIVNAASSLLEFRDGITNSGSLAFSFGNSNLFGDINNASGGRIVVSGNSEVTFWDDLTHDGVDVKVSTGSTAVFFGDVSGPGPFSGGGTTFLEGDYQPGASPGSIPFGGDLHLGALNTLQMEIGGTNPGSEHDQLVVDGSLFLNGGILGVQLIDAFVPSPGDSFLLFDAATIDGDFGFISLPNLPVGSFWDTRSVATDGILRVSVVPADYPTWLSAWGIPGGGNADGDPFDDVLEYALGTDPTTANTAGDGPEFYTNGSVGGLRFDIPFPAASDLRYEVEASTSLQANSWDTIATKIGSNPWTGSGAVSVNVGTNGTQNIEVTDAALTDQPQRQFFRLRGTVLP